jgi:polyisoprenyl-phosphate glycosyltransferase
MVQDKPVLGLILPCYNEEQVLEDSFQKLNSLFHTLIDDSKISPSSFMCFVDDGSRDSTWEVILQLKSASTFVRGIKLSRNFGHQNALLAGLSSHADHADCLITIDVDLQDDLNAVTQMIDKFRDGYDIVYGVKTRRESDSFFKRNTALFFYFLMRRMGVDIIYNHADFRLSSNRAVKQLFQFNEINLFLRGIYPLIGFRSTCVYYAISDRLAGESKYSMRKMLSFALKGITAFSIAPLRLITTVGIVIFSLSLIAIGYSFYSYFFLNTVKGWMSIVLPIYFLGGIQLLFIGILGEYIAKIYTEVKRRPRFIIDITV